MFGEPTQHLWLVVVEDQYLATDHGIEGALEDHLAGIALPKRDVAQPTGFGICLGALDRICGSIRADDCAHRAD